MTVSYTLIVVADVDTKLGERNPTMAIDEEETEDWFGKKVQDTVENGLRVGMEIIAALAQAPSDRIENPEHKSEQCSGIVYARDIGSEGGSM